MKAARVLARLSSPPGLGVQLALSISIVAAVAIATGVYVSLDPESRLSAGRTLAVPRKSLDVLSGYVTSKHMTDNPAVYAPREIPQQGSAFSYCFWVYIDPSRSGAMEHCRAKTLFCKGTPEQYALSPASSSTVLRYRVAMPCVSISERDGCNTMTLGFNTTAERYMEIPLRALSAGMDPLRTSAGAATFALGNWVMFTLAFEDGLDGTSVTAYCNDATVFALSHSNFDGLAGNHLVPNKGRLHILPDADPGDASIHLGDIKYFNYAVGPSQVHSLLAKGPPDARAVVDARQSAAASSATRFSVDASKVDTIYNVDVGGP